MDFWNLIIKRRSIRKFTSEEVSKEVEDRILKGVNLAPSAGNIQGYGIFSIRNPETKRQLAKAALNQKFISEAPLVLVFYADRKRSATKYRDRGYELYSVQDATIATTFAHLAAADLGLGSVWIGAFITDDVRQILGLPPDKIPVSILPIGHPAVEPGPANRRRKLDDLVTRIS